MEQRLTSRLAGAAQRKQRPAAARRQPLGIPTGLIRRNVNGCWNLGYCGMGCPTNAKQSMLVTTIPSALQHGASLLTRVRADKLSWQGRARHGAGMRGADADGLAPTAAG
jgi:hypothetical protein